MKHTSHYFYLFSLLIVSIFLNGCGGQPKEGNSLSEKKERLNQLQSELQILKSNISELEKEIALVDSGSVKNSKSILVNTFMVKRKPFIHQISLRGAVKSRNNISVSSEMTGRIEKIFVKEGDYVDKGDVLATLNADLLENSFSEIETNLSLAVTVFERQQRLWNQNVGTEMQYLEAKTNKKSLEKRLKSLRLQLDQTRIYAPFSGSVDNVYFKIGEMAIAGMPFVQLVNNKNMYVETEVSESFLGQFHKGDSAEISFPAYNNTQVLTQIASVGKILNEKNRTFTLEMKLPFSKEHTYSPNQLTIISLVDYRVADAIVIPKKIILYDDKGSFVFTIDRKKQDDLIANKTRIEVGQSYQDQTEILSGLDEGTELIVKGYQDMTDKTPVTIIAETL